MFHLGENTLEGRKPHPVIDIEKYQDARCCGGRDSIVILQELNCIMDL